MRDINELIGIIRGIDFDGIINDKEVVRLQNWVDQNRNLAYATKQVELIRLVDMVLADRIIEESERETMLQYCDAFVEDISDELARIYELNGIIEGVVCDGEINQAEVYRLNRWMEAYGEMIKDHEPSAYLWSVVDSILEDGIITEYEQRELLRILSERINKSQFETKLGYLCKQVKARKNIGIDLIDLLDNQEVMDEIHRRAEVQLMRALKSYTGALQNPEVVFVSLCLIGMLEYDGSFYDSVRRTYADLYRYISKQKIEGFIRSILNRYRADAEHDKSNGTKNTIISVVLSNAIVPSYFLGAFFEFIYDIYKINFEYDLPEDLYGEFKFVYDGLRSSMLSDGDNVQDNVTKKTYKLITTTKRLIADGDSIDAVIKLSIIVVKLIDKQVWNRGVKIYNPYLKKGFNEWLCTQKDEVSYRGERATSEWRSRWEPKYVLVGTDIYLVPPVHKVKSTYNYWDIYIQVLSEGKVIYEEKEPDIREIIAGYKVSGERIKIDSPLEKISYRLKAGSKTIYDSKEKLYREFIVFDIDGYEIPNNTDYKGTAVFCYKHAQEKLNEYYSTKGYKLASKNVKYGDTYYVENVVFNFCALIKPGIFGDDYDKVFLMNQEKDKIVKVFKYVKFLVFESESRGGVFEVFINGTIYKLSDFINTTIQREGVSKHVVELSIDGAGLYDISINQHIDGKKKRIAAFEFAIDPEYRASLSRLDESTFSYTLKSAFCVGDKMGSIELATFDEETISVTINSGVYYYQIPFELNAYRLSGSEWRALSDELWIGDINQSTVMDVYDSEVDEAIVLSDKGVMLDRVSLKDRGAFRQMPIGFLVSYKEEHEYTLIVFLKDGKFKLRVFCNNKCIMREETEIVFDTVQRVLSINPWFYGKGHVYCEVYDSAGESVYKSDELVNDSNFFVPNLKSYEEYTICFFEKGKGLTLKKNREMKNYKRVFYARADFVGKEFRISEVSYRESDMMHQSYVLGKTYIRFLQENSDGTYVAEIYWKDNNTNY